MAAWLADAFRALLGVLVAFYSGKLDQKLDDAKVNVKANKDADATHNAVFGADDAGLDKLRAHFR